MAQTLSIIKESFEKLKGYSYSLKYSSDNGFHCELLINDVPIAKGCGRKKKDAKGQASKLAHERLLKEDPDYGALNNTAADLGIAAVKQEDKTTYKIISDKGYCIVECKCGNSQGSGMSIDLQKAKQMALYNALQVPVQVKIEQSINILSNAQLAFQFARHLSLSTEDYDFFFSFITKIAIQYPQILAIGGYATQSMRITKPVLDAVVYTSNEDLSKLDQLLKTISQEIPFTFTQNSNVFKISFAQIADKKSINVHLKANLIVEQSGNMYPHYGYLQNYKAIFQQHLFAPLTFTLVHQWRQDSLINLPVEFIDYLIIQVTNELKYLNSPYQILQQILYLIQKGLISEIQEASNLNPFLQQTSELHFEMIKQLNASQIQLTAQQWDDARMKQWLTSY